MRQRSNLESGWYKPVAERVDPTFRIVQDLAGDLTNGEIAFPTFINATLRIRRALADPQVDADRVARTIAAEPLLAAKLVKMANSVALGAAGKPVADVRTAVMRVGYSNVHAMAASVAMAQLLVAKEMRAYLKVAEEVWRHSLDVAAIAFVLAKKLTKLNPDEALFAGLVHDVGRFYLLSKFPAYPELEADPFALEGVLDEWHAPIGHAVLATFGVTDAVLHAVAEHENIRHYDTIKTLTDVVALANLLSKCPNPLNRNDPGTRPLSEATNPEMLAVLENSGAELMSLVAALRE